MRIMWVLSGLSARLLGITGLAAAGILALNAAEQGTGDLVALAMLVTAALFCLVKAVQFLLPRPLTLTLKRTTRAWPRVAFLIVSLAWVLLSGFVVLEFGRQSQLDLMLFRALIGFVCVGLLLFMIFFISGVSHRALDAHQEAQMRTSDPAPMPGHRASQSPPRMQAKDYNTPAVNPRTGLRPRDMWDYYGVFILTLGTIAGVVAFRFGTAVQTATLHELIETNLLPIYLGITLFFAAPLVLITALRRPATRGMLGVGRIKRLFFMVAGLPVLGAVLTIVMPYDLAPQLWNLAMPSDPATLQYEVVEVKSYGTLATCLRLAPVAGPEMSAMTCGLSPDLMASVSPGTRLEATGPLSDYAHSLNTVTVLP